MEKVKNGVMMQYFEWCITNDGSLWKQLKDDARHLSEIGITSVWIPPAYKADEQQDEGYATYDLFDLGEFEQKGTIRTKYGTKEELQAMIDELHNYDICVYLDAVMNHKVEGDYTEKFMAVEVDPNQRYHAISEEHEIEGCTGYNFPGRGNHYSDFKWHWYHFTGTDYDNITRKHGVFRIVGEGKQWSEGVDDENANYDFLLGHDIDLNHPEVIRELNKWGTWVSNELNLDGMRLDAIKHMDHQFIKHFLETIRTDRGEEFYAVGEYWKEDLSSLQQYLKTLEYKIDLFDVPLHYKMFQASNEGQNFDLTGFFENTLVERFPQNAVTFVDNHDSQQGSSLESYVEDWFKPIAYGVILLMEKGYPCIFYGDYYGIDCVPSPHKDILDILLYARKNYAYGEQQSYFDHPNTAGFVRMGDDEHPASGLALLLSNGEDGHKIMHVGENRSGEVWHEITGCTEEEVTIDREGKGHFWVPGGKLAVWTKK